MNSFLKISFACLFMLTIASCKDKCESVVCPINQGCNSGRCYCADGLEGDDCTTYAYEKYVANSRYWFVSGICNIPNMQTFSTYFYYDGFSPINKIWIYNLFPNPISVFIRTDQSNQGNLLEIPEQRYDGTNTVYGQGTYNYNNRITLQLTYTFNGASYQCELQLN